MSSQANLVNSTNIGGKTVASDERSLAGVGTVDHRRGPLGALVAMGQQHQVGGADERGDI